jgi:hypothetical protein
MELAKNQITIKNTTSEDCRAVIDLNTFEIIEGKEHLSIEINPTGQEVTIGNAALLRLYAMSNYNIKDASERMQSWIKGIVEEEKTQKAMSILHDMLIESELKGKTRQQFPSWLGFTTEEHVDKFDFSDRLSEEDQNNLKKLGVLISPFIHFSANQFQANIIDIPQTGILDKTRLVMRVPNCTNVMMIYFTGNK